MKKTIFHCLLTAAFLILAPATFGQSASRERLSLNADWRFKKDDPVESQGVLNYEKIKDWVTATGNEFAGSKSKRVRPAGNLGEQVSYTQRNFDDRNAPQNVSAVTALIAGAPPALDQALGFIEMDGRYSDAAARSNLPRGKRTIDFCRNNFCHKRRLTSSPVEVVRCKSSGFKELPCLPAQVPGFIVEDREMTKITARYLHRPIYGWDYARHHSSAL